MRLSVLLFFMISCISCKESFTKNGEDNKKSLKADSLTCIAIDSDRLCYPFQWPVFSETKRFFLSQFKDQDKNTFFSISRYDTSEINMNVSSYLDMGLREVKDDTVERLGDYKVIEIGYDDSSRLYTGTLQTTLNGKSYVGYVTYIEVQGVVYDMTLKIYAKDSSGYNKVYKQIIDNYLVNGKPLLPAGNIVYVNDLNIK